MFYSKKRGQITVFIILGIILLVVASIGFYFYSRSTKIEIGGGAGEFPVEIKEVQQYMEDCINEVAVPGIYLIAYQGGKYYLSNEFKAANSAGNVNFADNNLLTLQRVLPYYVINSETKFPTTANVEYELTKYINNNIQSCTDFTPFLEQGIIIKEEQEQPAVKITLAKSSIIFLVEYPLRIFVGENAEKEYSLEKFGQEIPSRLGEMLEIAQEMSKIIAENPAIAHLPEFMGLNMKHNVMISVIPFDDETTAYSIYDNAISNSSTGGINTRIGINTGIYDALHDVPLIFWFAVRNSNTGANQVVNTPPIILNFKDFMLKKGVRFEYALKEYDAEGDDIVYTSSDSNIPIQKSGVFNFTPQKTGTFYITITAADSKGLESRQKARFIVED